MHYYKKNIGDYAKRTGRLSMIQHGAYTLLLDACYDREQFPSLEQALEWTWASTKEEIEAVEFVLKRFFEFDGEKYVQKRIQEELAKYKEKSEINSRIAIQRETKRREKSTKRAQSVHEVNTVEHEAPPNHKPLTINQLNKVTKVTLSAKCPTEQIIDLYHQILPELPSVRLVTEKRKKAIRSFWQFVITSKRSDGTPRAENEDQAIDWIKAYFDRARKNDFLMGKKGRVGEHSNWQCDLDYLLTDKGRIQVIEKTAEES